MYILCLIWLWTRSLKTEVEKLRMERLEVLLNVFACFVNLGKSEKQRKLWPIFLKKSKCWKRKEKEIFLALRFRIIFKRDVKNCKGVRSTDFNLWF